jgi:hypothetical protein
VTANQLTPSPITIANNISIPITSTYSPLVELKMPALTHAPAPYVAPNTPYNSNVSTVKSTAATQPVIVLPATIFGAASGEERLISNGNITYDIANRELAKQLTNTGILYEDLQNAESLTIGLCHATPKVKVKANSKALPDQASACYTITVLKN